MILTNHLQPTPVKVDFRLVRSADDCVSEFKDHPFEMSLESCHACLVAYFTPDELDHLIEFATQIRNEYDFRKLESL